jgi:pyrroline-5-carboxylate reductase
MFGIIGAGNIGSAILRSAISRGALRADEAHVFDVHTEHMLALKKELGITAHASNRELVEACDMILLAVKPNVVEKVLKPEKDALKGKALISIAAGWRVEMLKKTVGDGVRLLRAMPNTPLLVGEGMTAFSREHTLTEKEASFAEGLFRALGRQLWVEEYQMDAVTALSGSSPAFAYIFTEAMADAGVACGLSRVQAVEMAAQTLLGSAKMVLETGMHPGALKDMVCSPSGTTIAGVRALESNKFRSVVMEAVIAANDRSAALNS